MVASLYGKQDENKTIWVYLEHEKHQLERVSLELLGRGRDLADEMQWELAALVLAPDGSDLAQQAITHGADQVWLVEHPLLEYFTIEAFAHAACLAIQQVKPSVLLLGATPNGRDLAGRLAVRLRTGLNADCTGLRMTPEGVLVSEVSGFGGGVLALIEMQQHRPQMATVRPGVFEPPQPDPTRSGQVRSLSIELDETMIHTKILERVTGEGVDLGSAPVLVAGGRGIDGDFDTLYQLANLLGGDVGATRPPVDEGHIKRERQIGQTGVVCGPKIAICCGISGAFHFVVGIEKADTVIAINSDPNAPIFDYADYCIVGDTHQIIPALITALQKEQEVAYA
jgi:electron transfer flavoprotein alpha subunit